MSESSETPRWDLVRSSLLFQLKLLADGMRDFLLVPVSIVATIVGGVLGAALPDRPIQIIGGAVFYAIAIGAVALALPNALLAGAGALAALATGGIGGVHRGAETSFDISADLRELARSPVTVVAAGAKAILDLPKTLEVLETLGVPVIAFGQSAFPAFC